MRNDRISEERLALAHGHYRKCRLCEHRCDVDRQRGERGRCQAAACARVFRHRIEYGEELELVPSHLFYLSGCDLRCAFCIAEVNAFAPHRGHLLTRAFFADALAWGCQQGARNLQWVGGEPTIHIPAILDVMADCTDLPPIVWKSDFHATREALDLLAGIVDIYVADFKFGNDRCAKQIAGIDGYCAIVTRNLRIAAGQADLIVRHLLLPGHFNCCYRPIVTWLRQNLPAVKFSVTDGYLPRWRADRHAKLGGRLERGVRSKARTLAVAGGLNLIA